MSESIKSTEVRCSEQAKGGMKYELVLSEPALEPPKLPQTPVKTCPTAEDIENKLKAAEERRQSLEAQRRMSLNEKLSHLNEVKDKKQEFNNIFMQATRENLVHKMEANKENREAYLKSIQIKLRDHGSKVDEVRKYAESPKSEALEAIKKRLNNASESREAQINALQERLKEHDKHISEVRKQIEEQVEQLKERLYKKLEVAQENREAVLKEIQDKLHEHKSHVFQVRQMNVLNDEVANMKLQQICKRLDKAEEKRLVQLQAVQERLMEHERHVELVRQNRASNANANENSSG